MADKMLCLTPNDAAYQTVRAIKNGVELISLPKGLVTYMTFAS